MPAVGRDGPLHFADRAMVALHLAVAAVFRDMVGLSQTMTSTGSGTGMTSGY